MSYLTTSASAESECTVPISARISSFKIPMETLEVVREHLAYGMKYLQRKHNLSMCNYVVTNK